MEAWKAGCKGVTVYRDGSRAGVLISNEEKKEEETIGGLSIFPTIRPTVLDADIVRFQNNKDKWIAFIGLIDDRPYEIFTGLTDDEDGIIIPRWLNKGLIINRSEEHTSDLQSLIRISYTLTVMKK